MADTDRPPLAMTPTRKAILEDAGRNPSWVVQYADADGAPIGTYWGAGPNARKANQWTDGMEAADWLRPVRRREPGEGKGIRLVPTETGLAALAAYLATRGGAGRG